MDANKGELNDLRVFIERDWQCNINATAKRFLKLFCAYFTIWGIRPKLASSDL
jgi:hypothetical protein